MDKIDTLKSYADSLQAYADHDSDKGTRPPSPETPVIAKVDVFVGATNKESGEADPSSLTKIGTKLLLVPRSEARAKGWKVIAQPKMPKMPAVDLPAAPPANRTPSGKNSEADDEGSEVGSSIEAGSNAAEESRVEEEGPDSPAPVTGWEAVLYTGPQNEGEDARNVSPQEAAQPEVRQKRPRDHFPAMPLVVAEGRVQPFRPAQVSINRDHGRWIAVLAPPASNWKQDVKVGRGSVRREPDEITNGWRGYSIGATTESVEGEIRKRFFTKEELKALKQARVGSPDAYRIGALNVNVMVMGLKPGDEKSGWFRLLAPRMALETVEIHIQRPAEQSSIKNEPMRTIARHVGAVPKAKMTLLTASALTVKMYGHMEAVATVVAYNPQVFAEDVRKNARLAEVFGTDTVRYFLQNNFREIKAAPAGRRIPLILKSSRDLIIGYLKRTDNEAFAISGDTSVDGKIAKLLSFLDGIDDPNHQSLELHAAKAAVVYSALLGFAEDLALSEERKEKMAGALILGAGTVLGAAASLTPVAGPMLQQSVGALAQITWTLVGDKMKKHRGAAGIVTDTEEHFNLFVIDYAEAGKILGRGETEIAVGVDAARTYADNVHKFLRGLRPAGVDVGKLRPDRK